MPSLDLSISGTILKILWKNLLGNKLELININTGHHYQLRNRIKRYGSFTLKLTKGIGKLLSKGNYVVRATNPMNNVSLSSSTASIDPAVEADITGPMLSVTTSSLYLLDEEFNLWVRGAGGNVYLADYITAMNNMVAPIDITTLRYWAADGNGLYLSDGEYTVVAIDSATNSKVLLRSNSATYLSGNGSNTDFNMTNHDIVNIKHIIPNDGLAGTPGQILSTNGTAVRWVDPIPSLVKCDLNMSDYDINAVGITTNYISVTTPSPPDQTQRGYTTKLIDQNYLIGQANITYSAATFSLPSGVWLVVASFHRPIPAGAFCRVTICLSQDMNINSHADSGAGSYKDRVLCNVSKVINGPVDNYNLLVNCAKGGGEESRIVVEATRLV